MMTAGKLTREQFKVRQLRDKRALEAQKKQVLICAGTGCIAGGSLEIYDYIQAECQRRGMEVHISLIHEGEPEAPDEAHDLHLKKSGCHGFCEMGPLLQIEPDGILYTHVHLEDCDEIIEKTLLQGELIPRLLYQLDGVTYAKHEEIPFYHKQQRVVLENCGTTDAEDIDEYIARDGYSAFEQALFEMTDEAICKEISDSGLRGRGGGGFPAGRKWESVRLQPTGKKYVVCNGDEGDPGAFMDRSIMEGNPHSIIEGMLIAAVAAGSDEGYIYVRAEYPLAVSRLKTAIAKAEEMGLLGDNILGTDFCFHLHVNRGAGAFVCGEGSALTASIEGNRGMPRVKPPRTVEQGLWARPTVLNNVETFSNVPLIIRRGSAWYRSIGTERSHGTKAFALTGNVVNTGLIEVPMGTTLRQIIFEIGGGIKDGKKFKAQGGDRVMYTTHHPCWDAKNRDGLPPEMPFEYSGIAHLFAYTQPAEMPKPVPAPTAQTATQKSDEPLTDLSGFEDVAPPIVIPEGIPKALADLMRANNVSESDIRLVVSQRNYFPYDTPITNYPDDFVQGCLIGAWEQMLPLIRENQKVPF